METNTAYQFTVKLKDGVKDIEIPLEAFKILELTKAHSKNYLEMPESNNKGVVILVSSSEIEIKSNNEFISKIKTDKDDWNYAVVVSMLSNITQEYLECLAFRIEQKISDTNSLFVIRNTDSTEDSCSSSFVEQKISEIFEVLNAILSAFRYPFWVEASTALPFFNQDEISEVEVSRENLEEPERLDDEEVLDEGSEEVLGEDNGSFASEHTLDEHTLEQNTLVADAKDIESVLFVYKRQKDGVFATAKYHLDDNSMTVLKGSLFSLEKVSDFSYKNNIIRNAMIQGGKLVKKDGYLELQSNQIFSHPTEALGVVGGEDLNGPHNWRDENGVSLNTYIFKYYEEEDADKYDDEIFSEDDDTQGIHDDDKQCKDLNIPELKDILFTCKHNTNNANAKGLYDPKDNSMTVLKGSIFTKNLSSILPEKYKKCVKTLLEKGILQEKGEFLELMDDEVFNSPSMASSIILGKNATAMQEWKSEYGTLGKLKNTATKDEASSKKTNGVLNGVDVKDVIFTCKNPKINADAKAKYNPEDNSMMVLKGSKFTAIHRDSFQEGASRVFKEMIENNELTKKEGFYELVVDKEFNSPSQASCLVVGGTTNGKWYWNSRYGKLGQFIDGEDCFNTKASGNKKADAGNIPESKVTEPREFICENENKKVYAIATYYPDTKKILVHKGSCFSQHMIPSQVGGRGDAEKKKMIREGVLTLENGCYVLTRDYLFNTVSRASNVVSGTDSSRKGWVDEDGKNIAEVYYSE